MPSRAKTIDKSVGYRIKQLRKAKGITQKELAKRMNKSESTVRMWELEKSEPDLETVTKLAEYFSVSTDYLMGKIGKTAIDSSNAVITEQPNIFMIPVFESVSAGFGAYADNYITEYMPMYFSSPSEADESIFVTVKGDSMYPKIENGDIVLVHKQDSIDSGNIAVILVDGEEALVKKIVYGDNCIELHSVNPMYQTMYFRGADMSRIRVLGMVKKIIKSV